MKYFIITLIISISAVNVCFAQTSMKSGDIISRNSGSSSSYSEIKARTSRDAQMNKINNDLNFYRSKNDGASNQKVMELEREKSKIINIKCIFHLNKNHIYQLLLIQYSFPQPIKLCIIPHI